MYLNVVQLAESFGVEESDVGGWVRNDGLPPYPITDARLRADLSLVIRKSATARHCSGGFVHPRLPAASVDESGRFVAVLGKLDAD